MLILTKITTKKIYERLFSLKIEKFGYLHTNTIQIQYGQKQIEMTP